MIQKISRESAHPRDFPKKIYTVFLTWALQASVQVFFYFFFILDTMKCLYHKKWYHQNHEGSLSCNVGILDLVFVSALMVSIPAFCFLWASVFPSAKCRNWILRALFNVTQQVSIHSAYWALPVSFFDWATFWFLNARDTFVGLKTCKPLCFWDYFYSH